MKRSQRALAALARFCYRQWFLVFVGWLIITPIFAFFALKLEQKTTIKDLLPEGNLVVQRFEATVRDFQLIDRIVLAIECNPEDVEMAQTLADIFVETTREHQDVDQYLKWVNANLFDQIKESDYYRYLEYLPRMLPEDKLQDFLDRMSSNAISKRIEDNFKDLESGMAAKSLIEKDPLGLLDLAVSYKEEITGNYHLDLSGGYLTSTDQTMVLVLARPVSSNENVDFSVNVIQFLNDRMDEAKNILIEEENPQALKGLTMGFTGAHAITALENETIKSDVTAMFASSFLLVIFLFIVAYGRPLAIFYVGIPLISAEVWTLGLGYLLFGRLNLLTATFSAVIVGLGIDFAIHIYSRYLDERNHGVNSEKAMIAALSRTGLGTLIAGFTTALAFLAMGVGHFKGLFEFSVIASLGIVLCLAHMFILLPCMIFLREKWRGVSWRAKAQRDFQTRNILSFCFQYKKPVLVFYLLLTLFLGYQCTKIKFNPDLRSVRAKSNQAIALQSRVTHKVGGSLRSMTFVLETDSDDKVYQTQAQLEPILQRLKKEGKVARFDHIMNFLQTPENQIENMSQIQNSDIPVESFEKTFLSALADNGFRVSKDHQNYAKHLERGLQATEPIKLAKLIEQEGELLQQFIHNKDNRFHSVYYIYPAQGLWNKSEMKAMTDELLSEIQIDEQSAFYVTGLQVLSDEIKLTVQDSFFLSAGLAFLLVIGILVIHFRKVSLILLTLAPLVITIVWMLGTLVLLGIDINLLNFVATPLIIGISIDDGVHIVEKYLHRGEASISQTMASCAKAVTLTSLTTVFGFSSLFLAKYSGFHSLGASAILGVFFAWVASITLLPLLMDFLNIKFSRTVEEP